MRAVSFIPLLLVASAAIVSMAVEAKDTEVQVGFDDTEASVSFLEYTPATAVVWEGDTVTWRIGAEETPHTVSSPPLFDSSPAITEELFEAFLVPGSFMFPGQSFNFTFAAAGDFAYHCKLHPHMTAVVHVVDPTVPALPDASPTEVHVNAGWGSATHSVDRFGPAELTVQTGTKVIWTNTAAEEVHTVTADTDDPSQEPLFDSSPNFEFDEIPEAFFGPEGVLIQSGSYNEYSFTFGEAGTFTYFCKLHPGMQGAVIVLEKPEVQQLPPAMDDDDEEDESSSPGLGALMALAIVGLVAVMARRRPGR